MVPHKRSIEEEDESGLSEDIKKLEEERRLFYVAITRAKDYLTFSYPRMQRTFSEEIINEPSRFLAELPATLLQFKTLEESSEDTMQTLLNSLDALG